MPIEVGHFLAESKATNLSIGLRTTIQVCHPLDRPKAPFVHFHALRNMDAFPTMQEVKVVKELFVSALG